jgi:hypothetical protein
MGFIRTFILGAATVYGIQYITKKREDGSSILSDFMDDPSAYVNNAKEFVVDKAIQTAKSKVGL